MMIVEPALCFSSDQYYYLQEYPSDAAAMSAITLELKLCPAKTGNKLNIYVELGGSFGDGQGVEYELVVIWHC